MVSAAVRGGFALARDDFATEGMRIDLYQHAGNQPAGRRGAGRGPMSFEAIVVAPHFYDPKGERLRA